MLSRETGKISVQMMPAVTRQATPTTLSISQLLSPVSSSKLSDLYSLQQQHIALLEAQIAELSSSHDSTAPAAGRYTAYT